MRYWLLISQLSHRWRRLHDPRIILCQVFVGSTVSIPILLYHHLELFLWLLHFLSSISTSSFDPTLQLILKALHLESAETIWTSWVLEVFHYFELALDLALTLGCDEGCCEARLRGVVAFAVLIWAFIVVWVGQDVFVEFVLLELVVLSL